MTVRIRLEDGRSFTFEDAKEVIVVGRDPGRCDLLFPPECTVVGREHAAIRRALGHYRLQLNSKNAVFVDGALAHDGQELPAQCSVQLGLDGPEFELENLVNLGLRDTDHFGTRPPPAPHATIQTLRRGHRLQAGITVLVIGLVAIGAGLIFQTRTTVQELDKTVEHLGEEQGETMRRIIAELSKPPPPRPLGIEEAIRRATPSTYVVIQCDSEGREWGCGTAWVVKDQTLATNAHVGRLFGKLQSDQKLVVRSNSVPPREAQVKSVTLHPGYEEFQKIVAEYDPTSDVEGGQIERLELISACDVALLHVEESDALAPPLRIASRETLEELKQGDVVAYVGYPMENMAGGGVNLKQPSPSVHVGYLTALSDFFLIHRSPSENQLLQHSLPVAGGASGSPMVNVEGQVVGIVNAANLVEVGGVGRIATGSGVSYGQRAELLEALLDESAFESQARRSQSWREGIRVFASRRERLPDASAAEWISLRHPGKRAFKVSEKEGATETPREKAFLARVPLDLTEPAPYCLVIIAEGEKDVITLVFDRVGGDLTDPHILGQNMHWMWLSSVALRHQARRSIEAVVVARERGVRFRLHLYRAH